MKILHQHLHNTGENHKPYYKSGKWFDEALERAMNAVTSNGMKLKATPRALRIPATSLRDHLYKKI